MIRFTTTCLAALALVLPAHAADKERVIKFRTICLEMARGERDLLAGDSAGTSTAEVQLSRRIDKNFHHLTIQKNEVLIGTPETNEEGVQIINPAARIKIPAKGSQFLFLLFPSGKKKDETYRGIALADDRKSFPPGGYRFINLTQNKLRFLLGKQQIAVPAGGRRLVKEIEGAREDGRFPYVGQYHDGDSWNRVSTGYWYRHDRIRSFQIVYRDPRTKRLRLRSCDDRLYKRRPTAEPR